MKTYMPHGNIERKWYVVDAEGKTFGRLASQVAAILMGKNKPTYTPSLDTGDYVIVVNTDKLVLTGKKLDKKVYRSYTGYRGGLREISYKRLMAEKSDFAFEKAVERMMPKNKIGSQMLSKLYVYKGAEHKHAAQCPTALDL
ncbi:MAG: 50S ribosomal protein L13 [Clostridiales bacterium]|nr:50S ribosomal protein L13 [Clostridiales bacterium]